MKLSHSKLSKIMSCPMSYYLSYEVGIWPKLEKEAFGIGSAVHYGIEHNTANLSEYFGNIQYGKAEQLSEAMVQAYLDNKESIYEELLKCPETGEKLELLDEIHEIYVTGKLPSKIKDQTHHDFIGIIDLLLLTNKGFIIVDYKTSTKEPDWDGFLDQIYRYIFMTRSEFPDVPILKIGIINIRKSGIRKRKTENDSDFLNRLHWEYKSNPQEYVSYHEYPQNTIDTVMLNDYISNLSIMADVAQNIVDGRHFFINFANAKNVYGKTDFYDIFYKTPDAYVLYQIVDEVYDIDEEKFVDKRPCVDIDLLCSTPEYYKVLNKFEKFEKLFVKFFDESNLTISKDIFFKELSNNYIIDKSLLELYWLTIMKKREGGENDEQENSKSEQQSNNKSANTEVHKREVSDVD